MPAMIKAMDIFCLQMPPKAEGRELIYHTTDLGSARASSNPISISQTQDNSGGTKGKLNEDESVGKNAKRRKKIVQGIAKMERKEARLNRLNTLSLKLKAKKADFSRRWAEGEQDEDCSLHGINTTAANKFHPNKSPRMIWSKTQ